MRRWASLFYFPEQVKMTNIFSALFRVGVGGGGGGQAPGAPPLRHVDLPSGHDSKIHTGFRMSDKFTKPPQKDCKYWCCWVEQ